MLRTIYDRLLVLAGRPDAERWLALVSFIDGALFTIPPEILQLPMSIAQPKRSLRYALVGAVASAAGAIIAYYIGFALFDAVADPLLIFLHKKAEFDAFKVEVAGNAALWPVAFLLAPMPAAVAAGSVHLGIAGALLASLVGRGGRFLVVALLLRQFGTAAQHFIEHHFHWVAIVSLIALLGFVVVRYAL